MNGRVRGAGLVAALLGLGSLVATSDPVESQNEKAEKKAKPSISIQWDPAASEREGAVWLGYLMARANHIAEHESEYDLTPGPLIPRFEEEVEARETVTQIYRELKQADPQLRVPYFDDLSLVRQAGFIREYVWTYLRQESWDEQPAGLRLERFHGWRLERLPQHQPETRGGLSVD